MPGTFILRCAQAPYFKFVLSRPRAILGRSDRCDFVVDDPTVSRKHAEVGIRESRLLVTDLNSRNGTFVNDLRIQASAVVSGQVVRFGAVSFDLAFEAPAPELEEETAKPLAQASANNPSIIASPEALSEAQRKIFTLLTTGRTEKAIARQLDLSRHTVHNHIRAIFRILSVHSRAELFAALLQKNHRRRPRI